MELIESFIIDKEIKKYPFYVELAGITLPDIKYEIKRENSDVYVLEYVMEGRGYIEIDNKTFFTSKGDVYLLPKGSSHHYYSSKEEMEFLYQSHRLSVTDHFAQDGLAPLLHEKVDSWNKENFKIWCDYHYSICREPSVLGSSNHVVIIGKK